MTSEARLDQSPLHLLHRVRQCAQDLFQVQMVGVDLTARQFAVLMAAAYKNGSSKRNLIEITGIDRSTISQIMVPMLRKGLLKRRRTRKDSRAYAVNLTDYGRDVLMASEPIVRRIDEELIAALPAERASAFLENLRTIVNAFEPDKS